MSAPRAQKAHLDYLDGIRGCALIMVMLFHAQLFPKELHFTQLTLPSWLQAIVQNGGVGVDLFFVLSGYLITGILSESRGEPNYFRNFYARRALRIFPLYYFALAFWAVVFCFWPEPRLTEGTARYWPWLLTFTSNLLIAKEGAFAAVPKALQHFWSLAIEEQFYLLWPATVFLFSRRALMVVCIALVLLAPALRFAFSFDGWIQSYLFTFARFDGLAMGALLAMGNDRWRRYFRLSLWPALIVFCLFVFIPLKDFGLGIEHSAVNIFFAGLLATTLHGGGATRLFRLRALGWVGRRSYCGYVIHQPFVVAGYLLFPQIVGWSPYLLLLLPLFCLPLTEISWRLLERPFLKLKAHF